MKYFMVTAKCGHVGRGFYYEGKFFTKAESGKEAARKVRNFPRVKHDHKDAILSVVELDYTDFITGRKNMRVNPYFHSNSKQEQAEHWNEISADIHEDLYLEKMFYARREHQTHSLKRIYNNDPQYEKLKNYRGTI